MRNKMIVGSDNIFWPCVRIVEPDQWPPLVSSSVICMDARVHLRYVRLVMDEDWWAKASDLGSDTISSVFFVLRMRL